MARKLRLGVLFGGRSAEHEISIRSAQNVIASADPRKYEIVPIAITKDGKWHLGMLPGGTQDKPCMEEPPSKSVEVVPTASPTSDSPLIQVTRSEMYKTLGPIDVIFPVLHGPYGEDGTVQGLLELANVPYVGAGVLSSAVAMDKAVMKMLFAARGLPVGPYLVVMTREWQQDAPGVTRRVAETLHYPVFVKPANLGSSVGISKARSDHELAEAMALAREFDRKVVVEAAVPNAREIECAVLGNDEPEASIPGEIITSREFYDYEAKYLDDASETIIPANLTARQTADVQRFSIEAFKAVDGAGMSRVDFLLSRDTNELVLNEVNTIPGFTTISMYPKMWEASGLPYPALLDRLITLALERHAEKQKLRTSIT